MLRLVSRLAREGSFGAKTLGAAMLENVRWALASHCEDTMRRSASEQLTAPEGLPEVAFEPPPCAAEQAQAIAAITEPLSDHEREALLDHELFDLDFAEVAAHLRTSVPAAKMACSRARAKAREQVLRTGQAARPSEAPRRPLR